MDVIKTVREILAKRVDVSKLKPEDSLASLGLDSLDLVEVMLEIEYALHIEFTSEEITNLTTIQSVIDLINAKLA
ncbi:MAG: acyl carrier protein [Erysipelotrichaceae bacterium]|jgi:acyl carrier protein|nr:acyl carrier protein [Erysipelotrichaceae bacterium]